MPSPSFSRLLSRFTVEDTTMGTPLDVMLVAVVLIAVVVGIIAYFAWEL